MKRLFAAVAAAGALTTALSGCIVVPERGPYYRPYHPTVVCNRYRCW